MKTQGKCLSYEPSLRVGKTHADQLKSWLILGFEFNCLAPGVCYNQIYRKGEQNQNYPP